MTERSSDWRVVRISCNRHPRTAAAAASRYCAHQRQPSVEATAVAARSRPLVLQPTSPVSTSSALSPSSGWPAFWPSTMTAPKTNHVSMEETEASHPSTKPKPHHRHKVNNGERIRDQHGYRLRAAAICVRDELENEVLLVTGGKDVSVWVVPGGGIEQDETPAEAAVREVCEEAGVKGRLIRSLGTFVDDGRKHKTVVYVLRVSEELTNWEDRTLIGRRRQWLPMDKALCLLKTSQRPFLNAVKS